MRERTALEDQITAITRLEQALDDAVTLIELGEAEGDETTIREGEEQIRAAHAEAARRHGRHLKSSRPDLQPSAAALAELALAAGEAMPTLRPIYLRSPDARPRRCWRWRHAADACYVDQDISVNKLHL